MKTLSKSHQITLPFVDYPRVDRLCNIGGHFVMIGIYKITSPSNKFYIGQSTDIKKRFNTYKGLHCKNQVHLHRSLLKYGFEKHKFEIICECEISELNEKERYYQDLFCGMGKNGLNCKLTKSKDRKGYHSEETKLKISKSEKGKILSKETKNKMSASAKKRNNAHLARMGYTEESRKKMAETKKKIIVNSITGETYKGVKQLAEFLKVNHSTLGQRLRGTLKNNTDYKYERTIHSKENPELLRG